MPGLRVFVSSTAYDLSVLRGQLRSFIESLGFDSVLSDHSDVLYDPRTDAQVSCLREILNCDMVILIIGSRFGSIARPSSADDIDFARLADAADNIDLIKDEAAGTYSVTQLEILSAVNAGVPIFTFVDSRVLADLDTYEANRESEFIDSLRFGSLEDPATAKYIFSFISFVRSRLKNNALVAFSSPIEIENHLRKQWSGLFQRLLHESRVQESEQQQVDRITEQFDDLKAALLTSIGTPDVTKEVARGVLNFRFALNALSSIDPTATRKAVEDGVAWQKLSEEYLDIKTVVEMPTRRDATSNRPYTFAIVAKEQVLISRLSQRRWDRLKTEWDRFALLVSEARTQIYEAVTEAGVDSTPVFRPATPEDFEDLFDPTEMNRWPASRSDRIVVDREPPEDLPD